MKEQEEDVKFYQILSASASSALRWGKIISPSMSPAEKRCFGDLCATHNIFPLTRFMTAGDAPEETPHYCCPAGTASLIGQGKL